MKRVLAIGDLHGGNYAGVNSPSWWVSEENPKGVLSRVVYREFDAFRERHKKPDVLFVNGDAIDGKQDKDGGLGLSTTDRLAQCKMIAEELDKFEARKIVMTRGTKYHTGREEDLEDVIASELGAHIDESVFVDVEGVVFHLRHKISSSSVPYGHFTPIAKEQLWLRLWEGEEWPEADIILRSHTHTFGFCGGPGWLAMTLPALCAGATRYGMRECSKIVHFGGVEFVVSDGKYSWAEDITKFGSPVAPNVLRVE